MSETLFKWLEEASDGEQIEAVVLGEKPYDCEWPEYPLNKLMSLEEAMPYLTIEFYTGYGAPDNPPMHAWTKTWIIGTSMYDGYTGWFRIPRNPCNCTPCEPGGG